MKSDEVDDFLGALWMSDEPRYQLVKRVRELIHSVDPKISEEVKYGGLLYSARSPFCGLFSYERHVALEFSRGAELPDRHQVLEGEGKLRRHIKIDKVGDLFKKNVREYVSLAFLAASQPLPRKGAAARAAAGVATPPVPAGPDAA
ncbi:hypothetical protein C7444_10252 [Sphaerotilus hippei]|uniref:YdhG-like domain-containing protein n=1 Tax=Sphaerotilus hippei TaxID=744406 RepID=A0A318HC86_9BURK|nr:DUF1801 domain-containing protein [Sphaerotilus hippei]PXW98575.1 hypothetical protein C7444_10252 [Sphaerotilus hippei]